VRWIGTKGQRQVQQLDSRPGLVFGANAAGDLAGYVRVSCPVEAGCQRAVIWYAGGGSLYLGTLGGADSWARDINGAREVVGLSTSPQGVNTGFFWSSSTGMLMLPVEARWAAANGLSDVRADGTRLVVGSDAQGTAVVWVFRVP
jgi:uncharacterized membrane protein